MHKCPQEKEKEGQTIEVVRALREDGLLRIASLDLAFPSTKI